MGEQTIDRTTLDGSRSGAKLPPLLQIVTPLGDDRLPSQPGTLHAIAMTARERISQPFEIDITAVSTRRAIDPDVLLHKPVGLTVRRKDGQDRFFHGIVHRVDAPGVDQRGRWQYMLKVVPRLWFLNQTADCRIFQQQTAKAILETLFGDHDVAPVDFRLTERQAVRPYTTQYNETDLQFAHRIMQESGYFYYFEYEKNRHTMIIADNNKAFSAQVAPVHRVIARGDNVDIFDDWADDLATAIGSVRLEDYDPERPARPVKGDDKTRLKTAGAGLRSVYRWPAMTSETSVAESRARFNQEAAEAAAALGRGHGFDPNVTAGFRFTLASHPVTGKANVEYVVHGVTHRASDDTWLGGTAPPEYDCDFACFESSVVWRDPLSIPRPAMTGIFSGIVLGEAGEEIHADRLGRIKVRPLFDHRKDTTAAKSIFIRVLHAWSGDRWGWQHLPRVGTEVGISFMNGDPDNPVVVGCFYHEENPPVFPIPAEQTKQGFRSRSTLRGGRQDYNELSFDDRKGQEVVLLHAQRDHKVEVERNQDSEIGQDRTVTTQRDDDLTSRTGNIGVTADLGAITITAQTSITLRVGPTTIVLTPAGLRFTAPTIAVQSGPIDVAAAAITVQAAGVALATPLFEAPPPIPLA